MKKLRLEIEQLEVESFGTVAGEDGRGTVHGQATAATACYGAASCYGDPCHTAAFSCGAAPDEGCVVEEYTSFVWREDGLCQSVDIC